MTPPHESSNALKSEIVAQIAELSALLGMIPLDDTIEMRAPMMEKRMILSDWFSATRHSFFNLSVLIGKALDIQLQ